MTLTTAQEAADWLAGERFVAPIFAHLVTPGGVLDNEETCLALLWSVKHKLRNAAVNSIDRKTLDVARNLLWVHHGLGARNETGET